MNKQHIHVGIEDYLTAVSSAVCGAEVDSMGTRFYRHAEVHLNFASLFTPICHLAQAWKWKTLSVKCAKKREETKKCIVIKLVGTCWLVGKSGSALGIMRCSYEICLSRAASNHLDFLTALQAIKIDVVLEVPLASALSDPGSLADTASPTTRFRTR